MITSVPTAGGRGIRHTPAPAVSLVQPAMPVIRAALHIAWPSNLYTLSPFV